MNETCPRVPRPAAGRTTSRARPATAPAAACPAGPIRPASRPGSRTASGSGSSGKGAAGENGGPAGDLFVTVHGRPHRLFGRKGDNLTLDVPVTFDEAALGAEIKVPTLERRPGHAARSRPAPPTAGPAGPRPRRAASKDGTQGRPAGHRRGPGARRARRRGPRRGRRPTARPHGTAAPTRGPSCSRGRRDEPREGRARPRRSHGARTRRPGLRDQRGRRAHRAAPADAAPVRPARAGLPGPHRRRRPPLLAARHRAAPRGRRADRDRASGSRACAGSSSWRTRSPRWPPATRSSPPS